MVLPKLIIYSARQSSNLETGAHKNETLQTSPSTIHLFQNTISLLLSVWETQILKL